MTKFTYVRIDYDEGDPDSYRGVVLDLPIAGSITWRSGDPQTDWASYLEWRDSNPRVHVLETSSITHFFFDVPGWRMKEDERGREVIVPEDRPEVLKEEKLDALACDAAGMSAEI